MDMDIAILVFMTFSFSFFFSNFYSTNFPFFLIQMILLIFSMLLTVFSLSCQSPLGRWTLQPHGMLPQKNLMTNAP